jgi:hypothetical protein
VNKNFTPTYMYPILYPKIRGRIGQHPRSDLPEIPRRIFDLSTVVSPFDADPPMPKFANQTILVYTHIEMRSQFDHIIPVGFMNQTNWIPPPEPLIGLPREQWDEHQFMPEIRANGDWVDIVVNNVDDKGHPFHLVRTIIVLVSPFQCRSNICCIPVTLAFS